MKTIIWIIYISGHGILTPSVIRDEFTTVEACEQAIGHAVSSGAIYTAEGYRMVCWPKATDPQ